MKATDLMIGDWVLISVWGCKPFPSKVTSINYNSYQGKDFVDWIDTEDEEEIGMYNVQPISLTPEILEKNGFSEPTDAGDGTLICGMSIPPYKLTFQSIFGLPVLTIEDVVDDDNLHTCLVLKNEIYSVHELQHALKLCKIDKDIVL